MLKVLLVSTLFYEDYPIGSKELKKSSLSKLMSSFLAFRDLTPSFYLPILNIAVPADYCFTSDNELFLTSSYLGAGENFYEAD